MITEKTRPLLLLDVGRRLSKVPQHLRAQWAGAVDALSVQSLMRTAACPAGKHTDNA